MYVGGPTYIMMTHPPTCNPGGWERGDHGLEERCIIMYMSGVINLSSCIGAANFFVGYWGKSERC